MTAFLPLYLVDAVAPRTRDSATVARATELTSGTALASLGERASSINLRSDASALDGPVYA